MACRTPRSKPFWPKRTWQGYENLQILICPTDRPVGDSLGDVAEPDYAPRSYIINGFNDYFEETLSTVAAPGETKSQWERFKDHEWPFGFAESAMVESSDTIVFGEKLGGNNWNMHFDKKDPSDLQAEDSRHANSSGGRKVGGSNYAFGDGSVRYLRWPQYLTPVNMWYVTEKARNISRGTPP